MKKMYIRKKNNSGATLIAVLIVIAFIAVLGSISISAAMINLKMKLVDRKAQKTFYSCEEAVDEIYSQLGMKSMDALETAYQDLMATMVRSGKNPSSTDDDPSWYNYSINNDPSGILNLTKADLELRQKYMANIVNDLTAGAFDPSVPNMPLNVNSFRTLLNSYISVDVTNDSINNLILAGEFHYPYVASIDSCTYKADYADNSVYIFDAKNVKVEYITEDGYRSELTFDIGIKLPISNINFTSATQTINAVPSLGDYSLIADTGINIAANKQALIDGKVYAGGGGILARDSSRTTFIGEQVITKSDVTTEKQTQLTFSGSTQLWCNNIIIPKNYTASGFSQPCHGVTINLNGSTFVKNDLKINGASSNVYVGGVYNGYSNKGISDMSKDESSAIIVNGPHSNLTLNSSYIYLAGRSYIVYDGTTNEPYRTGESLSFKGDQEVYLVPPAAVNEAAGTVVGNPYSGGSVNVAALSTYLTNEYFARSLLSPTSPFVEKIVGGQHFLYLGFKDAKAASDYMYWILSSDDDFTTIMTGLGMSADDIEKALKQKNYMKTLIEVNLKNLDQQNSGFIAPSGSVTSSGIIVQAEVNGASAKVGSAVSMAADTKQLVTNDLANRYTALTNVLDMPAYSLESTSFSGTIPNSFTGQSGKNVEYDKICGYGATVGERIVSRSDIIAAAAAPAGEGVASLGGNVKKYGTGDYPIVVANGGYTYSASSGFKGGIIVAIGNVNVEADYDGLIITLASDPNTGNININEDVNISNSIDAANLVESVCNQLPDEAAEKLIKVFRGTRTGGSVPGGTPTEEKIEIDSIRYNQLVYFDNWKKTEMN